MLDWLLKRKNRPKEEDRGRTNPTPQHPELKPAEDSFRANDFAQARIIASRFANSEDDSLAKAALKLIGLTYFREEQYAEATTAFNKLAESSDDAEPWFLLATALTLNGELEKGSACFDKSVALFQAKADAGLRSIPLMIYNYMLCLWQAKQYQQSFEQLQRLGDIHAELKITDGTFLTIRGVPFFEQTMEAVQHLLPHINRQEVMDWLGRLRGQVDEDGKAIIARTVEQLHL